MSGLTYIPRSQLEARLLEGWQLVPGMEYRRDEWAFLAFLPPCAVVPTAREVAAILKPFFLRPAVRSNMSAAASHRAKKRSPSEKKWESFRAGFNPQFRQEARR